VSHLAVVPARGIAAEPVAGAEIALAVERRRRNAALDALGGDALPKVHERVAKEDDVAYLVGRALVVRALDSEGAAPKPWLVPLRERRHPVGVKVALQQTRCSGFVLPAAHVELDHPDGLLCGQLGDSDQ
jgi:hypothetical protein